jgi:hypothetical protein
MAKPRKKKPPAEKRPEGRPTKRTPEITAQIAEAISFGYTNAQAARLKTNFTKLETMQWYDWMYVMSGCAGLTNWSRAVLVIAPSKLPGTYRFIAAKRFNEIQWTEREYWFAHSKEEFKNQNGKTQTIVQWVPANSDQIGVARPEPKKKKEVTAESVWAEMQKTTKFTRKSWREWVKKQFQVGRGRSGGFLGALLAEDRIQESRRGINPLKFYSKNGEYSSRADCDDE